jgi:hypothetical protein
VGQINGVCRCMILRPDISEMTVPESSCCQKKLPEGLKTPSILIE